MSAKVGILSDTHGIIWPKVLEVLETCDYILHAGDFAEERILDKIRFMGKLYAVRGNSDGYWAKNIAPTQRFCIEGLEFFMIHDRNMAGTEAKEADVIVYGHTHVYSEEVINGQLWLNPGSCTCPRRGTDPSFVVMEIDGKDYRIERILL